MYDGSSRNREGAKRDGRMELRGGACHAYPFLRTSDERVPIVRVSQARDINRPTSPLLFREQKTGMDVAPVTFFQFLNHLHRFNGIVFFSPDRELPHEKVQFS